MALQYNPNEHIQTLMLPPRAEGILDQREITIQSYRTTVPFDFDAIKNDLENAWLTPSIRFGVFSKAEGNIDGYSHAVVLGLQDDISIRAYDYDHRRPLWYSWQDIIVDTVSMRYYKDDDGMLCFTTTGGGRRITEERLEEFNRSFLGIPKEAVFKRHFDLTKLRQLCFGRFIDRLYMLRFSDPSGEEYRSIDHALFQSRQYIDPEAKRLQEVCADTQVKIESFDSDITIRSEYLAEPATVRFFIRGNNGSLRIRFPKQSYKGQINSPDEQAKVFYDIVDTTVKSILDEDYYADRLHMLEDLDIDLGMFPDMVDLAPYRGVLLISEQRKRFFDTLDLGAPWQKWQPHLRALNELLPSANVAEDVMTLITAMVKRDPLLAVRLLAECQKDAKIYHVGELVVEALSDLLQTIPEKERPHTEETILSWAIAYEQDTWDVDPDNNQIKVLKLRSRLSDFSIDIVVPVLWKLIGVFHDRLIKAKGDKGLLLQKNNWCITAAKNLPFNHFKMSTALRLVAEKKVPASISDATGILKEEVADFPALDEAVLNQFGLPLWPCLAAYRQDGHVVLENSGIGTAIGVKIKSNGTLFSEQETHIECDLKVGESLRFQLSGKPKTLDVRFSKYGTEHFIGLPLEERGLAQINKQKSQTISIVAAQEEDNRSIEYPVLTDPELTLLADMQSNIGLSRNRKTIAFATKISDGTLKIMLKRFEKLGLVHRPNGERMGYTITGEGTSYYNRFFPKQAAS